MKKILLFILVFIALCSNGMGQMVPLFPGVTKNDLYLDLSRVYSYNQYEKSRWGLGLQYDISLGGKHFNMLSLSGYGAYGYADQRFKWGARVDLQSLQKYQTHTYVDFFHDITPDAPRYLNPYNILDFNSTGFFMTRLFSDTWRLTLGFSRQASGGRAECFELRLSRERGLHYGTTLLYPPSYSDLKGLPYRDFAEGRVFVSAGAGFRFEVLGGIHGDLADLDEKMTPFCRVLMQYDNAFYFSAFELDLFGQAGFANSEAPYSRLFDLGGTWGSTIALERSLYTARPNEFTTNLFTLVNLKLTTREPLFRLENKVMAIGTAPSPFVLCNGAWGMMGDYTGPNVPDKGIAEVGAGVDGLVVWSAIRWGGAVIYRLTPASAAYHLPERSDNLVFVFTAKLDL